MDEPDEAARQRRKRNVALGAVLGALVLLFFAMSIVQWSHHMHH
jgi:hypothetical protein